MASKASDRERAAHQAGLEVAGGLRAAEAAVDAAMTETLTLASLIPADAPQAGPVVSARALGRARAHLIRAHRGLADVARHLGLDETSVGPLDKPEDTPPIGGGPRRKRPAPSHPG
ncbi:MAG: hypothetical protein EBR82_05425 [Caulobacteraceae bacterium]|nr:hypothetical protein [Caulobacteraceae bacterium]